MDGFLSITGRIVFLAGLQWGLLSCKLQFHLQAWWELKLWQYAWSSALVLATLIIGLAPLGCLRILGNFTLLNVPFSFLASNKNLE